MGEWPCCIPIPGAGKAHSWQGDEPGHRPRARKSWAWRNQSRDMWPGQEDGQPAGAGARSLVGAHRSRIRPSAALFSRERPERACPCSGDESLQSPGVPSPCPGLRMPGLRSVGLERNKAGQVPPARQASQPVAGPLGGDVEHSSPPRPHPKWQTRLGIYLAVRAEPPASPAASTAPAVPRERELGRKIALIPTAR